MSSHIGELAGLSSSFLWAIGSLIFARSPASAGALNLFKNAIAAVFFLATLWIARLAGGGPLVTASASATGYLALSGVVGLVIGDTLYFRSLQILGPRRALVVSMLAPPLAATLGWAILGERPGGSVWLGIAAVVAGVFWVVREGQSNPPTPRPHPGSAGAGIAFGSLAALCQAVGGILAKAGMQDLDSLEACTIRIAVSATTLFAVAIAVRKLGAWRRELFEDASPLPIAAASVMGTYLGIWGMLTAFKFTSAAVATTVTSLSPIFVIPIAWIFLGQKAPPGAIFGAALAVGGVAMLFYAPG